MRPKPKQRDMIMKTTTQFTGTLSRVDRALTAAVSMTTTFALTTVIAAGFQGVTATQTSELVAMLAKAFA
jgi:hypothetical protein